MACGDTYLLYDDEYGGKPHLHIVISEPDENEQVVLVSVTTRRAKSDLLVCLAPGDHPFIEHPSVITFAYSKVLTLSRLRELLEVGEAFAKEIVSPELLARAQSGMLETDRAPHEVKNLFRKFKAH